MMGTNDTGYINKVAIGGHIALDTVLLISYLVEFLKGSRMLSYFLVIAAFLIIPVVVELVIYFKKKDAVCIRHILAVTYGIFYLFAIFTTNSIGTFTYILPFFISCAGGTILAVFLAGALKRTGALNRFLSIESRT